MTCKAYRTQRILRQMAWQRAKGELLSMLETYWGDTKDDKEEFEKVNQKITAFIEKIEDG